MLDYLISFLLVYILIWLVSYIFFSYKLQKFFKRFSDDVLYAYRCDAARWYQDNDPSYTSAAADISEIRQLESLFDPLSSENPAYKKYPFMYRLYIYGIELSKNNKPFLFLASWNFYKNITISYDDYVKAYGKIGYELINPYSYLMGWKSL